MKYAIWGTAVCLVLAACDGGSRYSSEESASSIQGAIGSSLASSSSTESQYSSSSAQARCSDALAQVNRSAARDALEQFFIQKDLSAIDRFWKDPYIQHNPIAQSGVENFRNVFQSFLGSVEYEIYGVWAECDLALVLGRYGGTGIIFDMFRLDDGKFIEHWDSDGGQATASIGSSVFTTRDAEKTHYNREQITSLYEDVLIPGGDNITTLSVGTYLDESRLLSRDYLGISLSQDSSGRMESREYKKIHHVIADGDFVFVLAEATVNGEKTAVYDLYQLEDGLAFQYWSSRRATPTNPSADFPGIF